MKLIQQLDQPQVKKRILIFLIGAIAGILMYYYLTIVNTTSSRQPSILAYALSSVSGALISFVIYAASKKLDILFPWKTQLISRFIVGVLSNFSIALAIIIFLHFAYIKITGLEMGMDQGMLLKLAILLFILMLIYTIIYFALYSYYAYAIIQIETVEYERKQIDLQLQALKSQLSAHLLFNNLNTISSLAHKNTKTAELFIRGLTKLYNYSLSNYHSKLVTLAEELSVVKSYLNLLKARYGDVVEYHFAIKEELSSSKIPPLTLQMLVENAVKHNRMDAENKLHIDLCSNKDALIVKNNITTAPKNISSFKIGLKNIEARYQLIHKKSIRISSTSDFMVELPIIQ